jgi:hypothetical protein
MLIVFFILKVGYETKLRGISKTVKEIVVFINTT